MRHHVLAGFRGEEPVYAVVELVGQDAKEDGDAVQEEVAQGGSVDGVVQVELGVGGEEDEEGFDDDEALEEAEGGAAQVVGPAEHEEGGGAFEDEGGCLAEEADGAEEEEEGDGEGDVFVVDEDEDVLGQVIVEEAGGDDADED